MIREVLRILFFSFAFLLMLHILALSRQEFVGCFCIVEECHGKTGYRREYDNKEEWMEEENICKIIGI